MKIATILLLFIISLTACPTSKKGLYKQVIFQNLTSNTSLWVLALPNYCYDTLLPTSKPAINDFHKLPLGVKESQIYTAWQCKGLKDCIEKTPNRLLCFFVFDMDTIINTNWSDVVANITYLKRFIINASDVNNESNLILTYP
jgi:hypothetical protein